MMRRCFVFAAADMDGLREVPKEGDLVIAADAGYRHCQALGIVPDLLLGDFDSMEEPPPDDSPSPQVPEFPHVERVPVEKDDTDAMLALKAGLSRGCGTFYIYGAAGGRRLDHSLANLQGLLYLKRRGASGYLYGEEFVWTVLENGTLHISRSVPDGLLSIFSLTEFSEGVSLAGVQYPLEGATLKSEFPLGVSNHITAEEAVIRVCQGSLLVGWQLPPIRVDGAKTRNAGKRTADA